ncbi:hypothetical protein KCU65_g1900, partial [Aureobasidium melanogenum]
MQFRLDSEFEKLWKKFMDHQSRKCCKKDSKLGFVVMREQHEQLTEDVKEEFVTVKKDLKEEFTTVKKEQTLINIKVDTYKASVVPLKKQFREQETMLKNLLADFKELQNEFEDQYEDAINLVSVWIREEREKRREENDETRKDIAGHDRQFIRMQNEIAEYVEKITEARNEVIRFREQLMQVVEDRAEHNRQLAEQSQGLAEHRNRHNVHDDRHNSHEERLTAHDAQLLGHGERLAEHNEQLLGLDDRLSAHDDKSAGHNQKLNELNAWKLEMEKRVTEVEERDSERKEQYDNLKAQYNEQQELVKRLNDQVDDLHNKLADANEARIKASEENQAYVDFVAKERIRTIRLEQNIDHVLEEQKKMKQDHHEWEARVKSTLLEKSRGDLVAFKAQATKIEALESQTGNLTSLVEQLQTHLAQLTHLPRQPVQASDLEARVQTLEQQTIQHTGLKDWQARMELYFHGSRDTMFTWARGELKEHQSSLDSQIESLKAQSDCQEKDVKMMKQRLEDQDLKYLTLRALALSKTNQLSTEDAFPSCEKVIERQPEDDATWNSSPTLMMADEDLLEQTGKDAITQAFNEPDAGFNGKDCTTQPEMEIERSNRDPSPALYDPIREITGEQSPAIEDTAQTPSSPLSSVQLSIVDEAEETAESNQQYAMAQMSANDEDSQCYQEEDSTKGADQENYDPVHAQGSTRNNCWSEKEIKILLDTMHESEDWNIPIAERLLLCEQRLREEGFRRTSRACRKIWSTKLGFVTQHRWSEREIEILRDTMRGFDDQSKPMPEHFVLCEQSLKEQGFSRTELACKRFWNNKLVSGDRRKPSDGRKRPAWSKEEIEILHETMKDWEKDPIPLGKLFSICEERLREQGFDRSAYACHQRYYKGGAEEYQRDSKDGAKEEYVWTEDQICLLGKAFQATMGVPVRPYSDQIFRRISEMLNETGEMTVPVTPKACMEQWYRMPAEERCKIANMKPLPHAASLAVCPGQKFAPLPVENSSLAEESSAEHTEQASYLLGHLASNYDSGPSQELQEQNSSHVDQSALCNAGIEQDEIFVAPISAYQGTTTSPLSTETSSSNPTVEGTEISPQRQIMEQLPDTGRTLQVIAQEAMDEQVTNEDPGTPSTIHATTESGTEQQGGDHPRTVITQDEPPRPSDSTPQDPLPASEATASATPANFRCYEWMQMNVEPDPAAQSHTTDQMTLDKSPAMSVDRPSGGEEEPPENITPADLADAVADEIAEHCEETTNGWGHLDIGFWIADSN